MNSKTIRFIKGFSNVVRFFFLFMATPAAYGSSQARGWIRATAAGLHHSHSNTRSELQLQPVLQLSAMLDPYSIEWGQGSNLHPHKDNIRSLTQWAKMGTPRFFFFNHILGVPVMAQLLMTPTRNHEVVGSMHCKENFSNFVQESYLILSLTSWNRYGSSHILKINFCKLKELAQREW